MSGYKQTAAYPEFDVDVDRWMAQQVGFTASNVAQSLLVSLSERRRRSRTDWLTETGVELSSHHADAADRIDSVDAPGNTRSRCPISRGHSSSPTSHRFRRTSRPA